MVTLIAEHWGDAEAAKKGMEAFKKNSASLKNTKGLISRLVLRSQVDPYKFTTVTTFASQEAYEGFTKGVAKRNAQRVEDGGPPLFRSEKLEGYDVLISD